ncbi:hypothetical protein CPB84DRAFT_1752211 [Gymnopilus junonius]|uniref:Uncharacterized protein n=1 Tax=Gymnopilus junonius TaxID=109634 RepID=A0A9P5NDK1_GYMJU|nr:hypothetical protein CPB84DRAFT_1752211 [Gymnopilus junonius]
MKAAVAPQPQNVKAKRAGGRCSYCSSSVCTNSRSSTNSSSDSGSSDPTTPSKLSPCAYMNVHKYAAIQEWASTVSVSVSASASANVTANASSTQPTESTYANPTRAPSLSPSRYFYEPPPSPSVRYSNLNQTQNRNWDRDTSKSPHLSSPNRDFLSDHTPQYPQQDFNLLSPRYRLQPARDTHMKNALGYFFSSSSSA